MGKLDYLKPLSQKGYTSLTSKVFQFYKSRNEFPSSVSRLWKFCKLEDKELITMENRGKLERKLSEIKSPKVMLLRTFLKECDNVFVFARYGYELGSMLSKKNINLGLSLINEDLYQRMAGHCTRNLPINVELARIKWKRLGKMPRNRNSPMVPFYGIKDAYTNSDEITMCCEKQKLNRKNLDRVKELISSETKYDLSNGEQAKRGLEIFEVTKILEGIV